MVTEQLYWRKILCSCFRSIWLWLLISVMKRCVERCAMQLYHTSLNLTSIQSQKLTSLDKIVQIVTLHGQTAVANEVKRHAVILVKKCLNYEPSEIFYFLEIRRHAKKNKLLIMVSWSSTLACKIEKSCFRFMRIKFHNSLHLRHRQAECTKNLQKLIKDYFKLQIVIKYF